MTGGDQRFQKRDQLLIRPLTDGFCLEELSCAAFPFTLAVDGGQLYLVAGLWLQVSDGHLVDGACSITAEIPNCFSSGHVNLCRCIFPLHCFNLTLLDVVDALGPAAPPLDPPLGSVLQHGNASGGFRLLKLDLRRGGESSHLHDGRS